MIVSRLAAARTYLAESRTEQDTAIWQKYVAHFAAVEQELDDLLCEAIPQFADFDTWLRDEDPAQIAEAEGLVHSLYRSGTYGYIRADEVHRTLEQHWLSCERNLAEDYAQDASFDAQFHTVRHYADRRGF